jgi:uncharacterized protein (DUF1697 family)
MARTYVALIRGINVGSRKRVAMADLRAVFVELGAEDVRTHVQSGNIVFRSRHTEAQLARAAENEITAVLGIDARVLVRSARQLGTIVGRNPFVAARRDASTLHATFLAERPERGRGRALSGREFGRDELHLLGREVYLHCPDGYGRSKLTNAFIERELGVAATTRNWKTVTKLAELVKS